MPDIEADDTDPTGEEVAGYNPYHDVTDDDFFQGSTFYNAAGHRVVPQADGSFHILADDGTVVEVIERDDEAINLAENPDAEITVTDVGTATGEKYNQE